MPLSNTALRYYDANVLRLPADKRTEYHAQVDRLVAALSQSIRDKTEIRVTMVKKAGSFAKFTILRRTSTDPVDVDVVFYISDASIDQVSLQTLNDIIYDLLVKVYPTKKVEDFVLQRKATTVTFIGTGLSVDVVPVIQEGESTYGWQFDLRDESKMRTCAPLQIQFIRDRKTQDNDFRTLVRLAKKWRNHFELTPLKSFTVELLMAYLLDKEGVSGSVEQRFCRFLLYIAQSRLKDIVSFPENVERHGIFSNPVVILDPVNSLNNVAARITEAERVQIVKAAREAWETANFASAENDTEAWKEVFGPRFRAGD